MRPKWTGILLLTIFLLSSGCASNEYKKIDSTEPYKEKQKSEASSKKSDKIEIMERNNDIMPNNPGNIEIDLQQVKPNEVGQIMILMYHAIGEPEAEFRRTPENFRKDLQHLYDNGYRPISLKDYVAGNITTEAGFTPIVLTFDDGWQDNFNIIKKENGELVIDPDSAIGILENFNKNNPDFPLEATFFINDDPFEQEELLEYKLKYIVDKGLDIGNHTLTHINFTSKEKNTIKKEIADIVSMVKGYLPDYEVNTLALPFGSRPKNKELEVYLKKGEFEGVSYKNSAILNVGWDPYKSPFDKNFNPLSIHRIRASDLQEYVKGVGMYDWLKRFENGERIRFISDGDPKVVTIPEGYEEYINENKIDNKTVRSYELSK